MSPKVTNAIVQVARAQHKTATVNTSATDGAQIGVNLYNGDGSIITQTQWNALTKPPASTLSSGLANDTTDDLNEGEYNLYFTNLRAQNAVGSILESSANVTLTYVSGTSITANLTPVTLTAGGALALYGFDAFGRLSQAAPATTDNLPQGTTNLYSPIVTAIAKTALSGQAIVALDGSGNAYYPNLSVVQDVENIAGITLGAAASGAPVKIAKIYVFTEPGWGWSQGRVYCALTGGGLTQTPPSVGAIVEVARVISSTTILVDVQPGILL